MVYLVAAQLGVTFVIVVLEMRNGLSHNISFISIGLTVLMWLFTLYILLSKPVKDVE